MPVKSNLQLVQQRDEDIAPIIQAIISGKTLCSKDEEGKCRELNQFSQQWNQLVVEMGFYTDGMKACSGGYRILSAGWFALVEIT